MRTYFTFFRSPIGEILLTSHGTALTGLYNENAKHAPLVSNDWDEDDELPVFEIAKEQLREYFEGERSTFDLDLDPSGTEFQKDVWNQLQKIPFGKTITYQDLAERVGRPKAVRAVGSANGRNPISIMIPCHRVIGADGTLTGYAGGLARKNQLITLERNTMNEVIEKSSTISTQPLERLE
jgi:methylated-DNA-[protein]-cysteine S-methyltransferase